MPSSTRPAIGGLVSTMTPSELDDEHKLAVLHAITVTKYCTPSTKCSMSKRNSGMIYDSVLISVVKLKTSLYTNSNSFPNDKF